MIFVPEKQHFLQNPSVKSTLTITVSERRAQIRGPDLALFGRKRPGTCLP